MKKILFLILHSILVFCLICGNEYQLNLSNKISFASYSDFNSQSTDIEISKNIMDTSEKVVVEVLSNSQFNYDVGDNHSLTSSEVIRIKSERKQLAEKYHISLNLDVINQIPLNSLLNVYVSKYFPIVSFEVDSKFLVDSNYYILNKIAEITNVKNIFVSPKKEYDKQGSYDDVLAFMNAYNEAYNGTLTGNGVVVGVLDTGVVDATNENFSGQNLIVRDHLLYIETVEEHATAMASIIGSTYGIAKNATILSVEAFQNLSGELDWMIDRDVDVVNMSIGDDATGTYGSMSATVDYMIKTYGITCCVAAGNYNNDNQGYVPNPGLAFNAITVGNCISNSQVTYESCYLTNTEVDKPTIMNYGEGILIPRVTSSMSGTSVSTAFTTGAIALLMEQDPTLKLYPARVTALLTASSNMVTTLEYLEDSYLSDKGGSGTVNFGNAKSNINNYFSVVTDSTDTSGDIIFTGRIYMETGDNIRMSLCWLANSNATANSLKCNDYDMSLCRPAGAEVQSTWGTTGTVDMINYTAEYTGNYWVYIVVGDNSIDTSSQTLFVSWSIE